jgi:hypothetical protein
VKDNAKKSYFIRMVDVTKRSVVYDQELFEQFEYKTPRSHFHTFADDKYMVGLNFADPGEASHFKEAVQTKITAYQQKKGMKRTQAMNAPPPCAPQQVPPWSPGGGEDQGRGGGPPGHEGYGMEGGMQSQPQLQPQPQPFDPEKGFDLNNLDNEWSTLFSAVGVTNEQLQDKDTAKFIYDFVQEQGGIEVASKQLQQHKQQKQQAPPLPPHSTRGASPPLNSRQGAHQPPPLAPLRGPPPSTHGASSGHNEITSVVSDLHSRVPQTSPTNSNCHNPSERLQHDVADQHLSTGEGLIPLSQQSTGSTESSDEPSAASREIEQPKRRLQDMSAEKEKLVSQVCHSTAKSTHDRDKEGQEKKQEQELN